MDIIISTLFDTQWGVILLGCMLFIALIVEFFSHKPRI